MIRPQLAPTISAGGPISVANDAIEMLLATTDKKVNHLLKYLKEAIYLLRFLLISSFSLILANKQYLILLILFNLSWCSFDIFALRIGCTFGVL